jgi:predicted ArsR family transcriptional regulator
MGSDIPDPTPPESAITAVSALADEFRRGMYAFIRSAHRPVTREDAAAAVGISRKLAAFHLDKLVEAGVLRASYGTASGVRKVGRAPKVYEPSGIDLQVSIPQRQHDVLADVLVDAVLTESAGETSHEVAVRVAHARGRAVGVAEREHTRPGRLGAERALTLISGLLQRYGFEPARETPTCVRLRNCPFHPLATKAPGLVCGINHAFLGGVVAGLDATRIEAVLEPRAGECCVELRAHT